MTRRSRERVQIVSVQRAHALAQLQLVIALWPAWPVRTEGKGVGPWGWPLVTRHFGGMDEGVIEIQHQLEAAVAVAGAGAATMGSARRTGPAYSNLRW